MKLDQTNKKANSPIRQAQIEDITDLITTLSNLENELSILTAKEKHLSLKLDLANTRVTLCRGVMLRFETIVEGINRNLSIQNEVHNKRESFFELAINPGLAALKISEQRRKMDAIMCWKQENKKLQVELDKYQIALSEYDRFDFKNRIERLTVEIDCIKKGKIKTSALTSMDSNFGVFTREQVDEMNYLSIENSENENTSFISSR